MHTDYKTTLFLVFLFAALFSSACTDSDKVADKPKPIKILEFKQGLIDQQKGENTIYQTGDKFTFKTNGTCTYDNKKQDCMWFGFSFKTAPAVKTVTLNCETTLTTPDTIGNPHAKNTQKQDKFKFELDLKGKNGHFINPQFITMEKDIKSQTLTTICFDKNQEVFRYQFIFDF